MVFFFVQFYCEIIVTKGHWQAKVVIELDDPAREWLLDKGYDPAYGARPMARTIDDHVKKPLVDELLFGKLSKGGKVKVGVSDKGDQLVFNYPK